jgi:hypothetical protein
MDSRFALLAALALTTIAGCAGREEELAEASVTSALQTSRSAGLGKLVYEGVAERECLSPERAAEIAADRPTVGMYPAECTTKTPDGANVHVALEDCTGPFGRVQLDGSVDATFTSPSCDELHADLAGGGDLTANGRPLHYSASADIRVEEGGWDVDWSAHWATTTKLGLDVENTSDLEVLVDDETSCLHVDGGTYGSAGRFTFDTEMEGLVVCPGECPAAGAVDVHVEGRRRERTLRIEFDGSSEARVTRNDGDVFTVDMICNDDEADGAGG